MDRFSTTAILLRRIDYGDADLILTFLTEDRGKMTAMAKSAKKSVRRFGGLLDLFAVLDLVCSRGRGMPLLQEASMSRPFHGIREDVTRTAYASYWAELVHFWSEEEIPQKEVFDLLFFVLAALDAGPLPPAVVSILFQMRFLTAVGLGPNLDRCGHCHCPLPETGPKAGPVFDLGRGAVVCHGCRASVRHPMALSMGTVKQLRWLSWGDLDHASRIRFSPGAQKESESFLEAFLPYHLGKVPKSLEFLKQIRK